MYSAGLIERADECAALLAALGNRNRLAIMCHLLDSELPVGEIAQKVGLSQSALSQHLAKLRAMELVNTRRDRQMIYYSCSSDHVRAVMSTLVDLYVEEI
ncbi:DNA-binding transcriptional ArsR family regulator [Mesorhizobium sp. J18]|uniref:ArsR/SmtB family transcription factor n=1 Tax=Mesorhizobium sp. J18 TaxID=935263 RepID=UPI00119A8E30|nr:metalloregulator ArsR/SmtB family transcription factor [Mesorhizobium sp. J18]TWG97166.1 DNA-binding transcriptional ArsR family regulator [Mesorhizobium sp. J18]